VNPTTNESRKIATVSNVLATAKNYRDRAGYSVIPVKADGTKAPAVPWKEYQHRQPDDNELTNWFARDDYGIGLVQGAVSGNAELLDIETGAVEEFLRASDNAGYSSLVSRCVQVRTPSGGLHLYYRLETPPEGNQKLARWKDATTKIETRGEGGQALAAGNPGRCHSSGNPYRLLEGSPGFGNVPVITQEERAALFAIARSTNEFMGPELHRPRTTDPKPGITDGKKPGDDYNERATQSMVRDLLLRHGWQISHECGGVDYLVRPGKNTRDGHSATLGGVDNPNVFYNFSSSAHPFDENHAYQPFSLYALLVHAGDFNAAAKDLAGQGYGEQGGTTATRKPQPKFDGEGDVFSDDCNPEEPQQRSPVTQAGKPKSSKSEETVPATVTMLARENADFWHTQDGQGWATIHESGENTPIASTLFRDYLRLWYSEKAGKIITPSAVQSAVEALQSWARLRGAEFVAYRRKAHVGDTIYYDLCDSQGRVVKATPEGWEVTTNCPVRFRRTKGMLPLPVPVGGGSIEELRNYVNAPKSPDGTDRIFPLMSAWVLGVLGPHSPYTILNIIGQQGSAKSGVTRILQQLVDPSSGGLRSMPKDERDFAIAASNTFVVALDNLSGLPDWLSDACCRIATGAGFATRQLHTDAEEILFNNLNPLLMNGIGEASVRGDFLERCIILSIPPITGKKRKTEREIKRDFEQAQARILGAFFDIVAVGLRELPTTQLPELPRMADFMLWITACESACPWERGAFQTLYNVEQEKASATTLEGDVLAVALRTFLDAQNGEWVGTAQELWESLDAIWEKDERRKRLPQNASALSQKLTRIMPALRSAGYSVLDKRTNKGKAFKFSPCSLTLEDTPNSDGDSDAVAISDAGNEARRHSLEGDSPLVDAPTGENVTRVTAILPTSNVAQSSDKLEDIERMRPLSITAYNGGHAPSLPSHPTAAKECFNQAIRAAQSGLMPESLPEPLALPDGENTTDPRTVLLKVEAELKTGSKVDGWLHSVEGQKQRARAAFLGRWWAQHQGGCSYAAS
jgi:hypothetical protein